MLFLHVGDGCGIIKLKIGSDSMKQSKKKLGFIIAGISVVIVIVGVIIFFSINKDDPKEVLLTYVEELNAKDYEAAYELLSKEAQTKYDKETYLKRNTNIYSGIGADNFNLEIADVKDTTISYHMIFDTYAGELDFDHNVTVVKEDGSYRLNWDSTFIYPELSDERSISVSAEPAKRGTIYDRNGMVLAEDGLAMQVGAVPGTFNGNEETVLNALAEKLQMDVSDIKMLMSASWVQDGLFVPLKTIATDDAIKDEFTNLDGVQVNLVSTRIYPLAEKAAHLTGYIHTITAEELAAHDSEDYDETSLIGATGLEAIYEDTLRGQDGCSIFLMDANGNRVSTILARDVANGQDVKTTIDADIQSIAYDQLAAGKDSGVVTAMNPLTGEVLALVSAPAYDPNDFALGMSDDIWKNLNEDTQLPLNNRFVGVYTPGSTFKAITAAIGLDTGTITAEEDFGKVNGWKWQGDDSWGDYYVTTTSEYSEPSNLKNALVYSDNIYFARLATQIGSEKLAENLKGMGFTTRMNFPFTMGIATFGEDEKIKEGTQLADTGYGQGQLQINPLHLTALYSSFVNEGNVMYPYLDENAEHKNTVWLDQIISKAESDEIFQDLCAAMETYGGTSTGLAVGGKTGTAEVGDEQLAWLSAVTKDGSQPLAITLMIENTKEKDGSHYAIPLMRSLLASILG